MKSSKSYPLSGDVQVDEFVFDGKENLKQGRSTDSKKKKIVGAVELRGCKDSKKSESVREISGVQVPKKMRVDKASPNLQKCQRTVWGFILLSGKSTVNRIAGNVRVYGAWRS